MNEIKQIKKSYPKIEKKIELNQDQIDGKQSIFPERIQKGLSISGTSYSFEDLKDGYENAIKIANELKEKGVNDSYQLALNNKVANPFSPFAGGVMNNRKVIFTDDFMNFAAVDGDFTNWQSDTTLNICLDMTYFRYLY